MSETNILNVGYDSTNYYLLGAGARRLLVDVGMPGTFPRFLAMLKRKGVDLGDIGYLLVTHYHPDPGGIAQELKAKGVRLIVLEQQLPAIPVQKTYTKPADGYVDITLGDTIVITIQASRSFLAGIGIAGEIIATPGHSDDSVTLVLDEGLAFTGDLTPESMFDEQTGGPALIESWRKLRALNVRTIYPGHGPAQPLTPG